MADTVVSDVPERSSYEITVGGERAGAAFYERQGERLVLTHTEVEDAFEGRGVGGQLARGALDDVRARGGSVVPSCPFIRGWIERHPDYADLVEQPPG